MARLYRAGKAPVLAATGGLPLRGGSQAKAVARVLEELGVPREALLHAEESESHLRRRAGDEALAARL